VRAIALLSKRSGARQARHATHGRSVLAQYILEQSIVSTGPAHGAGQTLRPRWNY